ncbi:hypothetical protein ACF0H5_014462 [Mactra antiquata]
MKSCDNFPFGPNSELKRRVATRKGDKLSVKLATDIHKLVSVLEGDDFSEIKDLISNAKPRNSQSRTPMRTPVNKSHRPEVNNSLSAAEMTLLKDTISALQADVLHLKQTIVATEKIRNGQIKTVVTSIQSIKGDLMLCNTALSGCINDTDLHVGKFQSLLEPIEVTLTSTNERISKLESFLDASNIVSVEKMTLTTKPCGKDITEPALNSSFTSCMPCNDSPRVSLSSETDKSSREISVEEDSVKLKCSVADDAINSGAQSIPVLITTRHPSTEDDGFQQRKRRKTKRFFVNGYNNDTTMKQVHDYVDSRGPKVSFIRFFPRSNGKLIIRLNNVSDDLSDCVLDKRFWSPGIICRPWLSRSSLRKQHTVRQTQGKSNRHFDVPPRLARRINESSSTHARNHYWNRTNDSKGDSSKESYYQNNSQYRLGENGLSTAYTNID